MEYGGNIMEEKTCSLKIKYGSIEIELNGEKEFVKDEATFILNEVKKLSLLVNSKLDNHPSTKADDYAGEEKQMPLTDVVNGNNSCNGSDTITLSKEPIHIKEFLEGAKKPNGIQAALLIAYYLYKIKGIEIIDEGILTDTWKMSGLKPPKNIWQAVIDGKTKHKWYDSIEKGKYKISAHGIYTVEHDLLLER